jgi:hypothetical protein
MLSPCLSAAELDALLFVVHMVDCDNIVDLVFEHNAVACGADSFRKGAPTDSKDNIRILNSCPRNSRFLAAFAANGRIAGKLIIPAAHMVSDTVGQDNISLKGYSFVKQ